MRSNRARARACSRIPSPLSPLYHFFHQHLLSIHRNGLVQRQGIGALVRTDTTSFCISRHGGERHGDCFTFSSELGTCNQPRGVFIFLFPSLSLPNYRPGQEFHSMQGFAHRPAFCFEKTKMVLLSWTTEMDGGPTGVPLAGSFLFYFHVFLLCLESPHFPTSGWKADWLVAPQRA